MELNSFKYCHLIIIILFNPIICLHTPLVVSSIAISVLLTQTLTTFSTFKIKWGLVLVYRMSNLKNTVGKII